MLVSEEPELSGHCPSFPSFLPPNPAAGSRGHCPSLSRTEAQEAALACLFRHELLALLSALQSGCKGAT